MISIHHTMVDENRHIIMYKRLHGSTMCCLLRMTKVTLIYVIIIIVYHSESYCKTRFVRMPIISRIS